MHCTDSMEGHAEIQHKLIQLRYPVVPITASTRNFLDKFIRKSWSSWLLGKASWKILGKQMVIYNKII